MSYYTVPEVATTYYEAAVISVLSVLRTWKKLRATARTWKQLRRLGLTTWKKLGEARYVTVYYPIDKPTTTYYEVSI